MISPVNLSEKFRLFHETWHPKIVGEVNDMYVKLAKLQGEFVWHRHEEEDEMFLVVKGTLQIRMRDQDLTVREGEFVVIPHGVDHMPVAAQEVQVLLLEPKATKHTGNVVTDQTVSDLEWI
ncbi:cupin domain-containing protein [Sulfobacillus thermosulfidooxidans]|uniref:cupin domain-containing protein n=1 Tax=Sulfobacillus thermosulfidooxidans TaxID=28034 RepID=UPI00041F04E0|nr:cupin domain-containing protein [Sulfobacillus thermosulfidooxidans]OLZ08214.1 mannose-6-phosphate isomerase [Sulfobacillus thermosulfidooxidans]OLZ15023.1 mannose-6-phosphate isomerase [Sulfobacillus thermosulfidooxidans]OLZ19716.1 mannose-6-phosphate isomerase [Sulfobacillus thermosulfidooxidans]